MFDPTFGQADELNREEVVRIEVNRIKIPILLRTAFSFFTVAADRPWMFIPYRSSRLVAALEDLGWPVDNYGGSPR